MKKRHIVLKTVGILFLILVLATGAFAFKNRKYISALIDGVRYSEADLGKKNVESAEKTISDIDSQLTVPLREMTQEEKDKIASGELSQTAVMAQIVAEAVGVPFYNPALVSGEENNQNEAAVGANEQPGTTAPAKPSQEESKPNNASAPTVSSSSESVPPQTTGAGKTSDELIAEAVARLYSLQYQYTAQIDALIGTVKNDYYQRKSEVGAAAAKTAIMSTYSSRVASMENSCDAKVEEVLSKLSSDLTSIGADTGIISTLRSAYQSEKSIQRAAYVNKYVK